MDFKTLAHNVMMEKRKKRIGIYCRVSSKEQAEDGYSIDEQERLLSEWCKTMDWIVYKCYSVRGISGKNIKNRPALKELLQDAEEGKFDIVVTWKISRIARNMLNLLEIIDVLDRKGIAFRSYSENFETETPMGKFGLHMMGAVAELERGTIAQNVKMGCLARAREGRWGGNRVLGYDGDQHQKQEVGRRIPGNRTGSSASGSGRASRRLRKA